MVTITSNRTEVVPVPRHTHVRAATLLAAGALLAAPAVAPAKPKHDGDRTRAGIPCSILTPGVAPGTIQATGRLTVSRSGNATLVCHGRVPQGPPRAVVVRGLRCPTPAGVTMRSHTVITPSGRVTLTCHVKARRR